MSGEQSMAIIQQIIQDAKFKFSTNGVEFLMWGWLVAIAAIVQYLLIQLDYPRSWLTWAVFMPLGMIVTIYRTLRRFKKQTYQLTVTNIFLSVILGFSISVLILISMMHKIGPITGMGISLVFYGFMLFVCGNIIRFWPMIAGAIINWIAGFIVVMYLDIPNSLLALAIAAILGYVVPGHLLRYSYNNKKA